MEEETKIPTSEDVVIKEEFSISGFQTTINIVISVVVVYFIFMHFFRKAPGYLSISLVDNRSAFTDLLYIFFGAAIVYLIFFAYGVGISITASKASCDKMDATLSAKESAMFALSPMVSFTFIRLVEALRVHYDNVLSTIGLNSPLWSVIAFMSTMVIFQAIQLVSDSEQKICVSTEDEARKYKEKFLKDIKEKQTNGK